MLPSPSQDLPVFPLSPLEWRPSREPSYTEQSRLPAEVDETVIGYPLREVIGRLMVRGPLGSQDNLVVGLHDGSVLTYGGYVSQPTSRRAVDARVAALLRSDQQAGCVLGAVGRWDDGTFGPVATGEDGVLCGIVFDFALLSRAYCFRSPLLALSGQYLVRHLQLYSVELSALDPWLPGAGVVAKMRSDGPPSGR